MKRLGVQKGAHRHPMVSCWETGVALGLVTMTISMALTQLMVPSPVRTADSPGLTLLLTVGVVGNAVMMGCVAMRAGRSAHVATSQDKTALALAPGLVGLVTAGTVSPAELVTLLLAAQAVTAVLVGLGFLGMARLGAARVTAWVPVELTIGLAVATALGLIKAGVSLGLAFHPTAPLTALALVAATSFGLVMGLRSGWGLLWPLCAAVAMVWLCQSLGLSFLQPAAPPDHVWLPLTSATRAVGPLHWAGLATLAPAIVVAALTTLLFGLINLSLVPDRANDRRAMYGMALGNLGAGALCGAAGHTAPGPTALAATTPRPHRTTAIAAMSLIAVVPVLGWLAWVVPPSVICACLVLLGVLLLQASGLRAATGDPWSWTVAVIMGTAVLMSGLVTATCVGVAVTMLIRLARQTVWRPARHIQPRRTGAEP